jgi:hypothetical protein
MKYLSNLCYILRHKWRVLVECWKEGLYLQGITHDLSKLSPAEFGPYSDRFFGGKLLAPDQDSRWEYAWLHHQHRNKAPLELLGRRSVSAKGTAHATQVSARNAV